MAERWAILVAVDQTQEIAYPATPYAEAGVKSLAHTLREAGYVVEPQYVLAGSYATKSIIESRCRSLKKQLKKADMVLFVWAGRSFCASGQTRLLTWDTLQDDPTGTSIAVADVVKDFASSKASDVAVALDLSPALESDAALVRAELNELFAKSPKCVGMVAVDDDETSQVVPTLQKSLWLHLFEQVLRGSQLESLDDDGALTVIAAQAYIERELPRLWRKHFDGAVRQHPQLYGEIQSELVLAGFDVNHPTGPAFLDPTRLKRIVFRSEQTRRIKDLLGFRKTFKIPDSAGPAAKRFLGNCAVEDLREELNATLEEVREHFPYKRKDLEITVGTDGYASLRTPDCEYSVQAHLEPADPSRFVWRRELGQLTDVAFLKHPGFEKVFGKWFDQLIFEFATPVNLEAVVDRLEEQPIPGSKLTLLSDGQSCELKIKDIAGLLKIEPQGLTVTGRTGQMAGLVDLFLVFFGKVGPLGEPKALR